MCACLIRRGNGHGTLERWDGYGCIVSVHTGDDEAIMALSDDGIEELKDMLSGVTHLTKGVAGISRRLGG